MKSSAFSRSLELAKLAAKVGLKEVRSGNLSSRLDQAVIIAESLSKLKGAAMKAGQLLSLELTDYFPKEAIEILSKLQNSAHAVDFAIVEKTLRTELGPEFKNLQNLSRTPLGIASIGQVHRATYQGQEIVLKVQYPGVAESIDSDIKILKTLAVAFCGLTGREMDLDPLFTEFRHLLGQEVDYLKEAEFQKEYKERVQSLSFARGVRCAVPEVISELTTERVLAMSYESGLTLRQCIQQPLSSSKKEMMAHTFLDLYFSEFFHWALVQTDSNLANFLVRDSQTQNPELVLLDFGASRRYSAEFIRNYIRLLRVVAEGDFSDLKKHAIDFGLIDPRESHEAFVAFEDMLKTAIKPFFSANGSRADFDFSDQSHALNSQRVGRQLSERLKFSPPPHELVFLHRKLGGVYTVLKNLGVTLDVSPYWKMMIEAEDLWKAK
ncbi:MAG: ABC1 kinase family protein [Bacillota bacterium]